MNSNSRKWFSYAAFLLQLAMFGLGLVLINTSALGDPGSQGFRNLATFALLLPLVLLLPIVTIVCATKGEYRFELPLFLPSDHGETFLTAGIAQQLAIGQLLAPLAHEWIRPLAKGLYLPVLTVAALGLLVTWRNRVHRQAHKV